MRSNERAAAAMGINLKVTKLIAFAIAAVFAGVVGVVGAYQFQGVNALQFAALVSVTALAVAYLGGISSVSGAIIAGALSVGGLSTGILQRFFSMGQFVPLVAGVGLLVTVLLNPEGISGIARSSLKSARDRVLQRSKITTEKPSAIIAPDNA
jgi:branched-chain amino acid transport system permease protein